MRHSDD